MTFHVVAWQQSRQLGFRKRKPGSTMGRMKVIALQSGSNGNCYFVRSGDVCLMVDAGISGVQAERRLASRGEDIRACQALFITHDHRDHAANMGVFHRKYGLPVYVTEPTYHAARRYHRRIDPISDLRFFRAGDVTHVEHIAVHSIPTPHDGADAVVFVIEDGQHRLGILTDLGHVFDGLRDVLRSLDAVIIESNYDDDMLDFGPYPEHLKHRIRGRGGHISNHEAAELLCQCTSDRLRWACLCHLSADNNCPDLAVETLRQKIGESLPLYVARRDGPTDVMEI